MVSTWVGDHHGIPCAVRPFSLSTWLAASRTQCRDAGPIPAILNDDHTHKALGLCLAQRPGAFFLGQPTHIRSAHFLLILAEVAPGLRLCLLHSRRRGPFFFWTTNTHPLCSFSAHFGRSGSRPPPLSAPQQKAGAFFLLDNQHTSIRLCSFWQTLFLRHSLRLLPTGPPVFKTKDETQNHTHHI